MTNVAQLKANRANARESTGPKSIKGKAVANRNATKHGLLSNRLLLEDEDDLEFQGLLEELSRTLNPVGAAERAIVEKVAVTLWRQRRLVSAETAAISFARNKRAIARLISTEPAGGDFDRFSARELEPVDEDRVEWCRNALEELEQIDDDFTLPLLEPGAPFTYEQLKTDASDHESIETFLAETPGGLQGYLEELRCWSQEQLRIAEKRPELLALAQAAGQQRLVLKPELLELFSRYQTTLDNQLYKALRALREAQDWRLKTLDASIEDCGDKARANDSIDD